MRRIVRVAGGAICVVLAAVGVAAGQASEPGESTAEAVPLESVVDTGYVVLNGRYLPPPYTIRVAGEELTINGEAISSPLPDRFGAGPWGARRGNGNGEAFRGRFGGGGARGPGFSPAWRITRRLDEGAVLVAFDERPIVFLDFGSLQDEFFEAVRARDPETEASRTLLGSLPSETDREIWSNWLVRIERSDALWKLADAVVREMDAVEAEAAATVAASRRIQGLAYPLTVVGMVLGVLALGHLLRSFPQVPAGAENPSVHEVFARTTAISVGLVVALSALDLAWTLLASQAGQMRELNPLASQWIKHPEMLLAFKAATTFVGCGLLFALRRYHRAQVAAWWVCLLCTVLTFRWVMFNSMFVA